MKAIFLSLVLMHSALVLRADPITNYFLAGEFLYSFGYLYHRDDPYPRLSFIVPVVDPDHIDAARKDVAFRPRLIPVANRDKLFFYLKVVPTADGLNRNYDVAGFPEWGWHATQMTSYGYGLTLTDREPQVEDLEWSLSQK